MNPHMPERRFARLHAPETVLRVRRHDTTERLDGSPLWLPYLLYDSRLFPGPARPSPLSRLPCTIGDIIPALSMHRRNVFQLA